MSELAEKLSSARLGIEQILLDPNNPRFADLSEEQRPIAETRYSEPSVQQRVLAKLVDGDFDIDELRKSIEQIGYIPVDQIVVRELPGNFFVVVEGNRRIAAIKSILQDSDDPIPEERKTNLLTMDVLVLANSEKAEAQREQWIVQGLRHVSGMKAWGPYQQSKAVEALMSEGFNEKAAAQTMGMRVATVAQLIRSLRTLEAMRSNSEFEEFATPRMFSYFQELQRLGPLKDWLGWSDAETAFTNIERVNEFYGWITDQKDHEGNKARRISRAIDLRDLGAIMPSDAAFSAFRSGRSLEDAKRLLPASPMQQSEWKEAVALTSKVLTELPTNLLEHMSEEERDALTGLAELIERRLEQRDAILRDAAVAGDG